MTVPTVMMMRKKRDGARNRGKRNGGTEQAFAETLRYLTDDWERLSPEELARNPRARSAKLRCVEKVTG